MMNRHKGRDSHPAWAGAHDSPGQRLVAGNGIEGTREHDAGLAKEINLWRETALELGGRIVAEYNANDLDRMMGLRLNRKSSHKERQAVAEELGFSMYAGSVQVPDHRMVIVWADGRVETRDFEHVTAHYNSRQRRAKAASGAHLSGIVARLEGRGRRVKDGPDVIGPLVRARQKSKAAQ